MQSRTATSVIRRLQFNRAFNTHSFPALKNCNLSGSGKPPIDDATCVEIDGSSPGGDGERGRKEETDKEYFSHHKASPLSEIEMADTRKPITKATDGPADGEQVGYFGGGNVVGWLPEQMESAEETMLKAAERWQWMKMRGDPDAPHSRVLRALRGEEELQL